MSLKNYATAKYQGLGKKGKGYVSTQSGALSDKSYGFNTRFENEKGTNPEEQIAAAHASCFAMATSFVLAENGLSDGTIETKSTIHLDKEGDDFKISSSELEISASIPDLSEEKFREFATKAKENCPISKLLNCEITLSFGTFKN